MVSSKSENNTIRVSVKNTTNVTKANASSINSSNPVNASNNQAKMYEQQALAHSNTSKYWAEQSESSALKSETYTNSLLKNEDFIAVSGNLETIVEIGQTLKEVDVEKIVNAEQNTVENATIATTQATIATEQASNASVSATNASNSELNAKTSETNAQTSSNNANSYMQQAKTYSESAREQSNIAIENAENSTTQASNSLESAKQAKTSETNALTYSNSALASANVATQQANIAKEQAQIAKEEVAKLSTVYKYKGSVATISDLPTTANTGDVYDTQETGMNYAWNGTEWDELGGTFDVSWGSLKGSISDNTDLQTALNKKANNNEVVHLSNTETISGAKTFTGAVNFTGSGDSNAIKLSLNTRINVHGTNNTVLGFSTDNYLIGHGNYRTLIRGKGERPYWISSGVDFNTAKTIALTSDIPDTSSFITMADVESKGYLTSVPSEYVTETELNNKGYLTEHQDISNLATKEELATKQDVLTAGDNITIEDGVISANVPQSGGGTVEIKTTAPIVYGGSEATTSSDNISTDNYGKNYLNSNAYFATADEFLPSDPSGSINRDSKTLYDVRAEYDSVFLQFFKCCGYGESYPQINLNGYNAMLRKFELGDIVVGDPTSDYDGITRFQMVFGNLGEDNTFVPKLVAKTFCWDGGGLGFFTQLLKPRTSFKGGYNDEPSFFEIDYDNYPDKVNYITLAETGAGRDYCGVKFVERNGRVGLNWIKRDGTEVETNSGSFNLEELEINCVLFNNYCYSGELVDSTYRGFNAENFFISHGSFDNVVVRMLDGSANTEKRIGLKYNTDDFVVEEDVLKINPDKTYDMEVGTIIEVVNGSSFTPTNSIELGFPFREITRDENEALFDRVWGGELRAVSVEEWNLIYEETGQCEYFGIDANYERIILPCIFANEKSAYHMILGGGQTAKDWSIAIDKGQQSNSNNNSVDIGLRKLVEVSDPSLMPSWYKVFEEIQPDGSIKKWCEQGSINIGSELSGTQTVNFMKEFADTNYLISKINCSNGTGNPSLRSSTFYNKTSKTAQTYVIHDGGGWEAKGYIKE